MQSIEKQIDEQAALATLSGNRQLLCELAEIFLEDSPELLNVLETAVTDGQSELARRTVHSLRGLCSTFYARPTIDLATMLEQEASHGSLETLRNGGAIRLRAFVESLAHELQTAGYVDSER